MPLPLVLASSSPRRRTLLAEAGVRFELAAVEVDESARPGESPEALTRRLAAAKARAAASALGALPARVVLGADTLVVLDEAVLGKPRDAAEAVSHLSRLLGRTHRVLTAVALVRTDAPIFCERLVESRVTLRGASEQEIRDYVASGEPLDKAGAYALQGEGRRFVEKIAGSESNVIGLPLQETLAALREIGVEA
jgi:septum formation protein